MNSERMKKYLISSFIFSLTFLLGIISLILLFNYYTPKKIFTRLSQTILEVKAYTLSNVSYGTAIVIEDNLLVTNFHVISYNSENETLIYESILVRSCFENEYQNYTLKFKDEINDIAILESLNSHPSSYKQIKYSNKKVSPGDICYAIGNANNLGIGITKGSIVNASIIIEISSNDRKMIQSDITITSGSSGGALLNKYGELLGITTLKLKDGFGDIIEGYVYSIPISIVINFLHSQN
ncbi:MAG: serine protease [Acholeplasmatales bacterium]|jgi:serine protease Do|nr:serine protease [Acholeplasmatales bacterium]